MASVLKLSVNPLAIANFLQLKPTSKNSQTNYSTKQTISSDETKGSSNIQATNKRITALNFRESVYYAEDNSNFFRNIHLTIDNSLTKELSINTNLKELFPFLKRRPNNIDEFLMQHHLIASQLQKKLTPLTIQEELKTGNHPRSLAEYIKKLRNSVLLHTALIISSCEDSLFSLTQDRLINKIYHNDFNSRLIQQHLDSSYYNAGFHFDHQTKFDRLFIERIKQYRLNVSKIPSLNKRLKIWQEELSRLDKYETRKGSEKLFIQAPQYRIILEIEIEILKEKLSDVGEINFDFVTSYKCFKPIHELLKKDNCIDISYKEFMAVFQQKKGKINWLNSPTKLIQFMAIIEKETTIFHTKNFEAFIREYFTLEGQNIKGELSNIINSKKASLSRGEDGAIFHKKLTRIIHSTLKSYLRTSTI
ncbi:hypothetical protein [Marinilabilia salmonicolor]|uniref:hypothetical protein n=1 Tax=Marinilabilia salmonicolor TaxID=989 RepID=UPI0012F67C1B|nr:hypothetical protein [Marinilabilia salmonicolor]